MARPGEAGGISPDERVILTQGSEPEQELAGVSKEPRRESRSTCTLPLHAMSYMSVVMHFQSHEDEGLNDAQVVAQREREGRNVINMPVPCCRSPCAPAVPRIQLPATYLTTRDAWKKPRPVDTEELVPGDLVDIRPGDVMPADIRVIGDDAKLVMNNASLTGNSAPVTLTSEADLDHEDAFEAANVAFCGTICVKGTAKGIVIRTGQSTAMHNKMMLDMEKAPRCTIS